MAVPAVLVREVSYLERAAQQPEAQPAKLARQVSAKPCGRMKLRKPLGIVSLTSLPFHLYSSPSLRA